MRSAFRRMVGIVTVSAFAMAGCAAHHLDLAPETAEKIKTVGLISIIPQAGIVPTVVPSAGARTAQTVGMMFGAIGGAIGGGIAAGIIAGQYRAAATKMAALVEPQKRIEIRLEFLDKLRQAAEGSSRFVIQDAQTVINGDGAKERDQALKEMPEDGVLTVLTRYYLSPDYKVLNVISQAELWQKSGEKKVFLGQWQYHSPPRGGDEEGQVIAAWAADNGEALVTVAHEAIDRIAQMMRIELLGQAVDPGDMGTGEVSYARQDGGRDHVEGKVLVRGDGWGIIRGNDGNLHAAPCPVASPPDSDNQSPDGLCVGANGR